MNKSLRVIMFPGRGNANENRYIDILADGLRMLGVDVVDWNKELGWQSGDIFHVHWPEVIVHIRRRRWQLVRGWWIEQQFRWTLARIKRAGGRLVWTAHDLQPHDARLQADALLDRLFTDFYAAVDGVFCLTESAFDPVRQEIPALRDTPFFIGRHPHYRTVFAVPSNVTGKRAALGATESAYIFGFLGTMRPNKEPVQLAQVFAALGGDTFLVMAGSAPSHVQSEVRSALPSAANTSLRFERIPEEDMIELYAAIDCLVFPGTDYFNSGTIYTALSLNVPVIAAWSAVNAEIQALVGTQWLYLFEGALVADNLRAARATLVNRRDNPVCDLAAFDPLLCATQHRDGYLAVLNRPHRAVGSDC